MSLVASEVHVVTRIIQGLSRFGVLLAYFIHKLPLNDMVPVIGVLCYRIVDVFDTRCLHLGIFWAPIKFQYIFLVWIVLALFMLQIVMAGNGMSEMGFGSESKDMRRGLSR